MRIAPDAIASLPREQKRALLARLFQERAGRVETAPLSFAQQRLWFLDQIEPGNSAYNVAVAFPLHGPFFREAFEASMCEVVRRHKILRTTFTIVDNDPVQQIHPAMEIPVCLVDLSGLPDNARRLAARQRAAESRQAAFDLTCGPLLRILLLRLTRDDLAVHLLIHHIVADGWSIGLLIRELSIFYQVFCRRESSPLAQLPLQYADYARWQRQRLRGGVLETQLAEWKKKLAGAAVLELPTDRPRPAVPSLRGAAQTFSLSRELSDGLVSLGRREGATPFMLALAGFQALLCRSSGQTDVSVGTPVDGRHRRELEGLIGLFLNTLVLRTDLSGDPGFLEIVRRARETVLDAFAYQDLPFDKLVAELQPERDLSRTPLFQVMIAMQSRLGPQASTRAVEPREFEIGGAKFELILNVEENADGLHGSLEYSRDLFDATTVRRMLDHLQTLLKSAVANPSKRLSALPLLSDGERHQMLVEWNSTTVRHPAAALLHALVEAQAARTPEAIAVVFEERTLSYAGLVAGARRLTRRLRRLGVGPGMPVGVCAERSPELVSGLLAILEAGGAYVPLDPSYPAERLALMLEDALAGQPRPILLTQKALESRLGALAAGMSVVHLDAEGEEMVDASSWQLVELSPDDLAYVIFTSGSTGRPKGAMNTHRAICNRLLWMQDAYGLTSTDRVLQKTPFSFDVSVWELFWPLMVGAQLVLARPDGHRDSAYLAGLIAQRGVTTLHFVPSMLRAFLEEPDLACCGSLLRVMASGEALPRDLVEKLHDRLGPACPGVRLHNLYGPTEVAVDATFRPCPAGECGPVPIGRPIANLEVFLLDGARREVPLGVAGELLCAGVGLARGYLGRPDLTAERFVPHPLSERAGERLYRTGDLARWLPTGEIDYLGRIDDQVKIRGVRIEPGEIEAVLGRHPEVREVAVVVRQEPQGARLVAWIVPRGGEPDRSHLREYLRARLPEPMVPAVLAWAERLPLLPNGKVDRKALTRREIPELSGAAPGARREPRNRTEEILAAIWKEVLRVDEVGAEDNFFELGGESILALQVVSRARRAGLHLLPKHLFEHPTVAALAALAGTASGDLAEAPRATAGPLPLTPIQRWFLEQGLPHPEHFNQALLLEVAERLDAEPLRRAVVLLMARHDALRLRFEPPTPGEAGWRQVSRGPAGEIPFAQIDLSALPEERQSPAIEAASAALQGSLSLDQGPLLRVALFSPGAERSDRLLLALHHLVVDGVSWRILLEDLETLYGQFSRGEAPALPAGTASFQHWAVCLAAHAGSPEVRAEAGFWLEQLRIPAPRLPEDRQGDNVAASARTVTVALDAEETRALLQEAPRAYRTQINDVLLTALAEAFAGWTGSRRLQLDLEGHGREEIGEEVDVSRTVGWFTSLFPVLVDLEEISGPGEALKAVKEQLRAIPRRGIGYGLLWFRDDETGRALRSLPRSDMLFNYLGQLDQAVAAESVFRIAREPSGEARHGRQRRSHLLEIVASVVGGSLRVSWTYSENRHLSSTIERLGESFLAALRRLLAHCLSPAAGGWTPSDFPLACLDRVTLDRLAASAGDIEDLYPASPLQQGMLFHDLHAPGSGVYVEQISLALGRELDVPAFERAWERLVARHAVLRTAFAWLEPETPLQVVHAQVCLRWQRLDWRELSAAVQRQRLAAWLDDDRREGFDLSSAPLLRCCLIDLGGAGYRFVWTFHHALLDGWSLPILLRELFALYQAARDGGEAHLERAAAYRDYIAWLMRQDLAEAETFWRRTLAGLIAPTSLGVDRTPPAAGEREERLQGARDTILSPQTTDTLRSFARRHRLTLNTLVQAAWALLLHHYSGDEDVVFGAVTSGRAAPLPGIESMVGLFINTLPARVRISPSTGLPVWLGAIQEAQAELRQYEHTPLARVQGWSEVPRDLPLFESILVFENYPIDDSVRRQAGEGLGIGEADFLEQTNYPLSLVVSSTTIMGIRMLYDARRFEGQEIARMLRHLEILLSGVLTDPELEPTALPLLEVAESHQLLVEWSDTGVEYPQDRTVAGLIALRALRHPARTAVIYGESSLTYGQLTERSDRLARELRARGAGPGSLVGVAMERSPELLIALLGLMQCGAAYLPLDLSYPAERLSFMLQDSAVPLVITQSHLTGRLPEHGAESFFLDSGWRGGSETGDLPTVLSGISGPGVLAYVIYTSGSTGRPKGVAVPHGGLTNFLCSMASLLGLGEEDLLLAVTPLSFDIAALEIYLPLLQGARVELVPREISSDGMLLRERLESSGTTVMQATPSTWRMLIEAGWGRHGALKALCGGEALPRDLAAEIAARASEVWNLYGPTETTIWSAVQRLSPLTPDRVTIGRPIANTSLHLLDSGLRPTPVGVTGELYIGGHGLAWGYLGRPELTAERFLPDPFGRPGSRLYRTGDLARFREDGALEILGRVDHQVKIRGFRIELEEVAVALGGHPAVREALVLARQDGPGETRLVAYVVPREEEVETGHLRTFLKERLPDHMMPAFFVAVDAMPLLPNGKVDRQSLAQIGPERRGLAAAASGPRTTSEALLAEIWKQVLRLDGIDIHANFFALGGDSILSIQIVSRAARAGLRLTPRELFDYPTIAELAAVAVELAQPPNTLPSDAPLDFPLARLDARTRERLLATGAIEDVYPAAPVQQGMLFHTLHSPDSGVYVEQMSLALEGELDPLALVRAWNGVLSRHAILRTAFVWGDTGSLLQVVRPRVEIPWDRQDWRGLRPAEQRSRLAAHLEQDRQRGFDVSTPPLLRLALIHLGEQAWQLVWSYHHALLDGWSLPILLGELFSLYEAARRGEERRLDAAPTYRDYIAWLEGEDLTAAEEFWRRTLAGFAEPTPLGADRTPAVTTAAAYEVREAGLSPAVTDALRAFARGHQLTLNTVVQGAWALLLYRSGGVPDMVFGGVTSGRSIPLAGIDEIVGLFINTLPVRVRIAHAEALPAWLARIQELQVEARQYEHSPLFRVQSWSEVPWGRPLFESMLAFENYPVDESVRHQAGRSLGVRQAELLEQTHYPLSLAVTVQHRLHLKLHYDARRFSAVFASRLLSHLESLLATIPSHSEQPIDELSPLTEAERHELLVEWNDTARQLPADGRSLHQLFEIWAGRTPGAPSVLLDEGQVTYGELNQRANRVAHHLRRLGVGPEVRVGLLAERSVEMLVGLLAILKAGGVYVPLDPAHPVERLELILRDAGIDLILTQSRPLVTLSAPGLRTLRLDAGEPAMSGESSDDPLPVTGSDNLAYVIYTSGSTGPPNAVLVHHRGVVNLISALGQANGTGPASRVALTAAQSFDASVLEVFLALSAGAALVIPREEERKSPAALAQALQRHKVTVLSVVPSLLSLLPLPELSSVTTIDVGGEACPGDVAVCWAPGRRLLNCYGPTEISIIASFEVCTTDSLAGRTAPAIGRPVANMELYVLGTDLQPLPIGVAGELAVGGVGVSRGYLGRPDRTAQKFVPHPFADLRGVPGARLYRTGDLVRLEGDGRIEFLGRMDHQVKIRGVRIEPGEIEAALARHPAVRQTAVLACRDQPGGIRLVAYVVPYGEGEIRSGELRDFLRGLLPDSMVPASFITLPALPALASGKVDRKALAQQTLTREADRADGLTPPRTPLEELVAGAFAEVLSVERVGAEDSFFDLGGHSLLAARLAARLQETFAIELPLREIFDAPTVAALAGRVENALLEGKRNRVPAIELIPRTGNLPLSFAQQRLWFLDRLQPGSAAYNISTAVRLEGRLEVVVLSAVLSEIVQRHEILRTTFSTSAGEPWQVIFPPDRFPVPVIDLRELPEPERRRTARDLARREARQPFDLARGPVLRCTLIATGEEEQTALLTVHHIASDGWSMGVLVRELGTLYTAFSQGQASPLPELEIQYADFAVWQRQWLSGEVLEDEVVQWRERLRGVPPLLELPLDRPRPSVQTFRGAAYPAGISPEILEGLKALARSNGATLFMTLLAALQALLHRYTGEHRIAVGTPTAGRSRVQTEPLIGCFVNTLVMALDLDGDPGFARLLPQAKEMTLWAHAHQDLPFEKLVQELQPERNLSCSPLFQVMLALQNAPQPGLRLRGLTLLPEDVAPVSAKFDLILELTESGGALPGYWTYNRDLFDAATIERIAGHFRHLLAAVAADAGLRVSELPLLSEAERQQALEWSGALPAARPFLCLHELFAAQADRAPDAVAVDFLGEVLSYRALDERASRLAHSLRRLDVGPEVLVGLCLERSPDLIAGALGILKAGGAYLPLDPGYPEDRLELMIRDSGAAVLLTCEDLLAGLPGLARVVAGLPALCLDRDRDVLARESVESPAVPLSPESLAYVIYTSGSTGGPKGVQVTHRGLRNLSAEQARVFAVTAQSRVLQFSPASFDSSVSEIALAMGTGATLCMAPRESLLPGPGFAELLCEQAITMVCLPPSALAVLPRRYARELPTLHTLVVAGEACPVELADHWATGRRLVNAYGPTETTVCATATEHRPDSGRLVLGPPLGGMRVHVLDGRLVPVPVGVPGELHVGGIGVARSYAGRPELTAGRFIPDPFADERGARLYKTGDLVRYLPGGELCFLGRIDRQVKVRGHRIEPGEVEAELVRHPALRDAAVLALPQDAGGGLRLVAFAVPDPDISAPSLGEIREHLARALPEPMLPSALVLLEALPLLPNGKVDRGALGRIGTERGRSRGPSRAPEPGSIDPRTPLERSLARLWCEVLRVDRIGVHDDFFALGGHSLTAAVVVNRLQEVLGEAVRVIVLFEAPTVADLAARLTAQHPDAVSRLWDSEVAGSSERRPRLWTPIQPTGEPGDPAPLSFAQQRLWFLDRLMPGSTAYNVPLAVHLQVSLDVSALVVSLSEIVRRHEVLRTTFPLENGEPVQRIAAHGPFPLPVTDLTGLPRDLRPAVVERLLREEARRPFDLIRGPVLRAALIALDEEESILWLNQHHIISDAWSIGVLTRELGTLYSSFVRRAPSHLPELEIQYADFARWQRQWLSGEVLEEELAFWKERLDGVPPLDLPTDRARSAFPSASGASRSFELSADLSRDLQAHFRSRRTTSFMGLLAGFQMLLARSTGQDDVTVGTPVAGRNLRQTEDLIGLFVNTLVLRADVSGTRGFGEILQQTRRAVMDAFAHQDLPFEKLVEALNPERDTSRTPLFQVMFTLQTPSAPVPELAEVRLSLVSLESGLAKFDLSLAIEEREGWLGGSLSYRTDLFDAVTIERMLGHLAVLLQAAVADPERSWRDLPLLTTAEQHELRTWNDTASASSDPACIQERVARQAARSPDAIAVIFGEEWRTYRHLDTRADQLARVLRRLGVGLESRVGLYLERSLDVLVALLATLRAGGTYVPLDPSYPAERLLFMAEDAGIEVLLTHSSLAGTLCALGARELCVDGSWETLAAESPEPLPPLAGPDHLAYILYTSGSTGRPKGVQIPHGALTNFLDSMRREPGLGPDDVLVAVTSLSFDIAALELYLPLLAGARIVLASREQAADGTALQALLETSGATALQATPTTWRLLVESGWAGRPWLKALCGGEALPPSLAADLLERVGSLWNVYGPTETTIWSAVARLLPDEPVSIGHPIANTEAYVVDLSGHLLPVGVPGELLLGGAGLARGYLGRPELTAERFVPDPFGPRLGARLYRTGDLARWRPEGRLECLGRLDQQVKVRGFRIEPGEIDLILEQHPGVREALTLARQDHRGGTRLVSYLVPRAEPVDREELRRLLRARLPEHMVPGVFLALENMPLLPNGKVDRKALRRMDVEPERGLGKAYAAPRTQVELRLVRIWEELLGIAPVGIRDDFFQLGGHSVLSVRLFARIKTELGRELPLATLFQRATVESLAQRLQEDSGDAAGSPLVAIQPRGDRLPFFCVHPIGGGVFGFRHLAQHLGTDQPFYGLQAPGLDSQAETPNASIAEMAACYLDAARTVQPHGPYLLGGSSFGGTIAFEMARQLIALGEEVALVVLLDTPSPGSFEAGALDDAQVMAGLAQAQARQQGRELVLEAEELRGLEGDEPIVRVLAKLREVDVVGPEIDVPWIRRFMTGYRSRLGAWINYRCEACPAPIALFRPCGEDHAEQRSDAQDPTRGWDAFAAGRLEVHWVPGKHDSMILEPHVQTLAQVLRASIAQALVCGP